MEHNSLENQADDTWLPSMCGMCMNSCGILVHRIDGKVVKIEGNPECPNSRGRLCPKGQAGMMLLYDPHRLKTPMKRTNPQKGIGIDPQWVEISWEEALDTIAEKLKQIRSEDPRKVIYAYNVCNIAKTFFTMAWAGAFGTLNTYTSAGIHCGMPGHLFRGLMSGSWWHTPDYKFTNYLISVGSGDGTHSGYAFTSFAQQFAEARARGMKVIAFDPLLSPTAEKADEWVPVRPGTDGAWALAMLNVILNELGQYDKKYIKEHTNGPYLIGPDGHYVRDKKSNEPMVWDLIERCAKPFTDPSINDYAILGSYNVTGVISKPGFQLLKDWVKKYTPEEAEKITTIPANTIRRIASEYVNAAMIGSTMVIDGHELPYRPACVRTFKGPDGHKHATLSAMALELLNEVVGNPGAVGGILGNASRWFGYPQTSLPAWEPRADADGLLVAGLWVLLTPPYPPQEIRTPQTLSLSEFFPYLGMSWITPIVVGEEEKWGIPYQAEMLINGGTNIAMALGNPGTMVEAFKKIPFIVHFALHLDESAEAFADIVLPDTCYLEELMYLPYTWVMGGMCTGGMAEPDWGLYIRQPIVDPPTGIMSQAVVLMELAERVGFLPDLYALINIFLGLKEPYTLNPEREYTIEDIVDRQCKSLFGEQHGLDWFMEHGVMSWPKKVEEIYWKNFIKVRVPIYFENILTIGHQIKQIAEDLGWQWDTSDHQPLPDWKPCPSYLLKDPGYELYAFYYRLPFHTFSWTYQNPWLDEIGLLDPWAYNVIMNIHTAKKKGIVDGEEIWLENEKGHKLKGMARLVEAIHPECVAIANCGGHWAEGFPIAKGKGPRICEILAIIDHDNWQDYTDMVAGGIDTCVKVKVYKESKRSAGYLPQRRGEWI